MNIEVTQKNIQNAGIRFLKWTTTFFFLWKQEVDHVLLAPDLNVEANWDTGCLLWTHYVFEETHILL